MDTVLNFGRVTLLSLRGNAEGKYTCKKLIEFSMCYIVQYQEKVQDGTRPLSDFFDSTMT